MLDWIIEFLEKKKHKIDVRERLKRKKRIEKLMWELYREGAIFKVPVRDLGYMKDSDIKC
ncbi:hypothetical protein [Clostridium baratii]|uniref:hypothetical protein n=1 Tax=Clostridium baratii TaxID=1561 RepID=UPI0030CB57FA